MKNQNFNWDVIKEQYRQNPTRGRKRKYTDEERREKQKKYQHEYYINVIKPKRKEARHDQKRDI